LGQFKKIRTQNLNRVSKEQRTKREEVTSNQKLMPDADAMCGPIPGRRRLHDAELEWRPRTWTQANTESESGIKRAEDQKRRGHH